MLRNTLPVFVMGFERSHDVFENGFKYNILKINRFVKVGISGKIIQEVVTLVWTFS